MKDRTFMIALFVLLGICLVLTAAHLIYAIEAYQHCSIIYFIGRELW